MVRRQNIELVQKKHIQEKQCQKLYIDLGLTRVSCSHEDGSTEYEIILDNETTLTVKVGKYGNKNFTIQEVEPYRIGNI